MVPARADVTGSVWKVLVEPGQTVVRGDEMAILESMKMEIPVIAPVDGTVVEVQIAVNDTVKEGQVLITVEETPG
jgi:acetyl-CoA carboxylase biotin carboxyl carrier protein